MFTSDSDTFKLRFNIETTGDTFTLRGIKKELKVEVLKEQIEEIVGIPSYLLQVYYLDECALVDSKTLSYFHILPDARLKVRVWETNRKLVIALKMGNWKGVEEELKNYLHSSNDQLTSHDIDRPLTALFIACFHGDDELVEKLLQKGVNPRRLLLSGRHALGVAVARGHMRCVEILLGRKVRPYEWRHERSYLGDWELQDKIKITLNRIEKQAPYITKSTLYTRLTNSQIYDSSLRTWLNGGKGQLYLCNILNNCSNEKRKMKDTERRPIFKL